MKKLKIDIHSVSPLLTELLFFLAYYVTLTILHTKLYWGIITTFYILLLFFILIHVTKSRKLQKIRKRLILHISINLFLLISLLIFLILSLAEPLVTIYISGIGINLLIEIEFIIYLGISGLFAPPLRNTLSISLTILSVILSIAISTVTKDNWIIIGLIGAFLNHVLDPDKLLSIQNRKDEEIKDIIKKNNLHTKFWILKGIGLSFILSWAASIFVFQNVVIMNKSVPQVAIIIGGIYTCILLVTILHYIFGRIIIESK